MDHSFSGALVAGNNWVANVTVAAPRAMTCVVNVVAHVKTVNPLGPATTLFSVASRVNGGAWKASGIWSGLTPAHPAPGALQDYQASAMAELAMKAGETWSFGCAFEGVGGALVGETASCSTMWVCH